MDELIFKEIESAKQASDRGRQVLLVIQITCIVIFVAAWHEIPNGWTHARLRTAQAAVWFLDCQTRDHPESPSAAQGVPEPPECKHECDSKKRHDECHYIVDNSLTDPEPGGCKRTEQEPFCPDEVKTAQKFLTLARLTPGQARKRLETLQNSFIEHTVTVAVPFFGITLDVNDLGILGGITFLLVLTWLLFSLRREAENIGLLFATAEERDLPGMYRLLDMSQVLSVPPRKQLKRNRIFKFMWLCLERILFFPPLLLQGFVVWNDYNTLPRAQVLNPELARTEFGWEVGLLIALSAITFVCLAKAMEVSEHWEHAHERLEKLAEKDNSIFVL
jgi:hypothetical protein